MIAASEFARPRRLDQIGAGSARVRIEADAGERAALAARFGLIAIEGLASAVDLRRDAAGILATGTLDAQVVQACVVSGDPVPATIEQAFTIRFLPEIAADAPDEVELDAEDCDTMFYSGGAIDLGEAAAQTLALALDPFPRSPGAAAVLREAGVIGEDELRPASGLAGLAALLKKE